MEAIRTVTVLAATVHGSGKTSSEVGFGEFATSCGGASVSSPTGDHLLVFPSATAAMRCAIEIQRTPEGTLSNVGVGVHCGEAASTDDLPALIAAKAVRIADLARAGEVLVSGLVRELIQSNGALEGELWFEEEREVLLRGLSGEHTIVPARWNGRRPIRAIVADDSALIREGVAAVLRDAEIDVVATVEDVDTLRAAIAEYTPDVALVDIRMPPTLTNEGLVAAEELGRTHPQVGVLVLSQHLELSYALRLVEHRHARRGYLLKDRVSNIDVLLTSVRRVADGGCVVDPAIVASLVERSASSRQLIELTDREREVLGLIAEGLSNRGIAERLVVTLKTVETHVGQIFLKLGLREEHGEHRRVAAVLAYLRATARA